MNQATQIERPARLSDAVARQLEDWISAQGLGPGAQLPTEKALCERFAVSRAVIREAISRLKADGCVRTRQGSGAYVAARPGQGVFRLPQPLSLAQDVSGEVADVFELRYLFETGASAMAAERRTEQDLARMRAALFEMRKAVVGADDAVADDDAFHLAVAEATGNTQLARFQVFMCRQMSGSRGPTWSVAGHRAGRAQEAQYEHERIFDAILARDPAAARDAAATHLICAARRLGLDPGRWRVAEPDKECT